MPMIRVRVVCALAETIATFCPTIALTSVDLPALGAPTTATSPQCWVMRRENSLKAPFQISVRAEPVEALLSLSRLRPTCADNASFFARLRRRVPREGQGFDRLSPNGWGEGGRRLHEVAFLGHAIGTGDVLPPRSG